MRTLAQFLGALALITASGVAHAGGLSGGDLIVLNSGNTTGALSLSGQATAQVTNVSVNSSASKCLTGTGAVVLTAVWINTMGGMNFSGGATYSGTCSHISAPVVDPFAGLSMSLPNLPDKGTVTVNAGASKVLDPGYYSGGIKINASSTVVFNPGVYYLKGQGFSSNTASLSGNGVTFVILSGTASIGGAANISLSPPASGPFKGVLFAQPAANTSGMSFAGGSGTSLGGAIYAPKALVTLTGGSTVVGQSAHMGDMVVADRITLNGQGMISIGDWNIVKSLSPPSTTGLYD